MSNRAQYDPGPARGASVEKQGDHWTLVVARDLRHAPEVVWQALTEPGQLREWAPFDVDANMGSTGTTVKLTTVGAPKPMISETTITRADEPHTLEYTWGDQQLRWELQPSERGTRLTLWHKIDRRFISWGAAGWHICFDVLDHYLSGEPLGRMVGGDALQFGGWQRLNQEYAQQFGIENRDWKAETK